MKCVVFLKPKSHRKCGGFFLQLVSASGSGDGGFLLLVVVEGFQTVALGHQVFERSQ